MISNGGRPGRYGGFSLWLLLVATVAAGLFAGFSQRELGTTPTRSGGKLLTAQAGFDVLEYDISLSIQVQDKAIDATVLVEAAVLLPLGELVLHLDDRLEVYAVETEQAGLFLSAFYTHSDNLLSIDFPRTLQPGERIRARINYRGSPREAPRPPWVGGFVWAETPSGEPWIAVACQMDGADLWWPVKDHPSDEPERVSLRVKVPRPLVVASNGVLVEVIEEDPDTRTYFWKVSTPINSYNVTLNIAPYRTIQGRFRSVAGEEFPVTFWAIPEHYDQALKFFPQISRHLVFLEKLLGPYPFRSEKYGVAEVPYLGMEHQTIIAYGGDFRDNAYGFDWLHFHELAHEWWGNLVSVADWSDHWLHEGFASYMEALYAESLGGKQALREYMNSFRPRIRNQMPLAPLESQSSVEKYFVPPDYTQTDGDVNFKGAWVLHSLRYLIGDDLFFRLLRRMAYPTPEMENRTDGSQCRFVTTEDFQHLSEEISGRDLDWFFQEYLRQPALPRLKLHRRGSQLELTWATSSHLPFHMPLDLRVGHKIQRVDMTGGRAVIPLAGTTSFEIDPDRWILMEERFLTSP